MAPDLCSNNCTPVWESTQCLVSSKMPETVSRTFKPYPPAERGFEGSPRNRCYPDSDSSDPKTRRSRDGSNGVAHVYQRVSSHGPHANLEIRVEPSEPFHAMEHMEMRQVRTTSFHRVPQDSQKTMGLHTPYKHVRDVSKGSKSYEAGGRGSECSLLPSGGSDDLGCARVFDERNRECNGAYPSRGIRCPRSAKIRRSNPSSAGRETTDSNGECAMLGSREKHALSCITEESTISMARLWELRWWVCPRDILLNLLKEEQFFNVTVGMFSSGSLLSIKINQGESRNGMPRRQTKCELPLAPITKSRMCLRTILDMEPSNVQLRDLLAWITTDRIAGTVERVEKRAWNELRFRNHVSRHLLRDLPLLIETGVFKPAGLSHRIVNIPLFKVPKAHKIGSRLIGDCRALNDLLPKPGEMNLPRIDYVLRALLPKRWLYQRDGKSYFYQFPIHESLQKILVSKVGNERGDFLCVNWTVLPMGFSFAPAIAQQCSWVLARGGKSRQKESVLIPWIDNFLMGADSEIEIQNLKFDFEKVCENVGLQLKEQDFAHARSMNFLGLYMNVDTENSDFHFVELDRHFCKKLMVLRDAVSTPRSFYELFSALIWANYSIMRQPLARWIHALEYTRFLGVQIAGNQIKWDDPIIPVLGVLEDLKDMVGASVNAKLLFRDFYKSGAFPLWTDAVPTCIAGVSDEAGDLRAFSSTIPEMNIFNAELLAAVTGILNVDRPVSLIGDNKAVVRALEKGHCGIRAGNRLLHQLWKCLQHDFVSVKWVPSCCNPVL